MHRSPFDCAPRRSLVAPLRAAAALSGERAFVPLEVEAQVRKEYLFFIS